MNVHFETFGHTSWRGGGGKPTTKQRNKILNDVLAKLQPPACGGAEGTPELLLRHFTCNPGPYHPVTAAGLREVGCSQPCSVRPHQAPFAGGGSPLCPAAQPGSPPPPPRGSPAAQHPAGRLTFPWPSRAVQGRGAWAASVSPRCSLRMRKKVQSAPLSPQHGKRAGPSCTGPLGCQKAEVAPSQLEGWKKNVGDGGQHFRPSD